MTQQSITDIVGLCIFIAAMLFSSEVANVVGPYMVIVIASSVGASFALARRDKATRVRAIWFFIRVVGLAILLTAGFAALLSAYKPGMHERFTVAPIALLVGFIGDDWPRLLAKLMRGVFFVIDSFRPKGAGNE